MKNESATRNINFSIPRITDDDKRNDQEPVTGEFAMGGTTCV
jgi:hypothetical protein